MISSLYDTFKHWSAKGSVYIISDTHFCDEDCSLMDPNWISPEEHIAIINKVAHKNDTLIHLGDVGDISYIKRLKAGHKVLIMGNHDEGATKFKEVFDEVYEGALFISSRILLSHERVDGLSWAFNIHGHDHCKANKGDSHHLNLASNVCGYTPISLGEFIKSGKLSKIDSIHRETIDRATKKSIKKKR